MNRNASISCRTNDDDEIHTRLTADLLHLFLSANLLYYLFSLTNIVIYQLLEHPRNKTEKSDPGDGVEAYTHALAQDESSIFAKNIYNFIACTRESREKIPHKVMRNIRQFMNGMKNYLVKHGEKDFGIEVDKARAALKHDEFLNLDQILEGVMHQLIVLPLKEHLYELFVDYYGSRGDIELIISNMKFAENKDSTAFGVKVSFVVEKGETLMTQTIDNTN